MNGMFNVRKHLCSQRCVSFTRNASGIGETEWAFKNTFTATKEELSAPNVDLVFEGLDTFATVTLVRTLSSASVQFQHNLPCRMDMRF
jgi:hypothetical protein